MNCQWGITPELRRTAARNGGVLHASTQAEPRSGLGLNELLGPSRVDPGKLIFGYSDDLQNVREGLLYGSGPVDPEHKSGWRWTGYVANKLDQCLVGQPEANRVPLSQA